MSTRKLAPIHPGEILFEEFVRPPGISQNQLGPSLNAPPRRINEIVHGKRRISADTALRLSRHLGTSEEFWLNLLTRFDLEIAKDRSENTIIKEVKVSPWARKQAIA